MNVCKSLRDKIMKDRCVQWFKETLERERRKLDLCEQTVWDYLYEIHLFYKDTGIPTNRKITIEDVETWTDKKIEDGMSRKTLGKKNAALKHYLHFVCGYDRSELPKVKHITRAKEPTVLSYEQIMGMVEYARNEGKHTNAIMIYVCFKTACRKDVLHRIRISDLHFDREKKYIRLKKCKGNKDHLCPISDKDAKLIDDYIQQQRPKTKIGQEDYLFLTPGGMKVNHQKIKTVLKRMALKTGITESVHPHTLRTSFIMWARSMGKREEQIMNITGHASAKTIYENYVIRENKDKCYEWLDGQETPKETKPPGPSDIDKLLEYERLKESNLEKERENMDLQMQIRSEIHKPLDAITGYS